MINDDSFPPVRSSVLEVPPPTPHIILLICLVFCIVGGVLMICSAGLGWVVEAAGEGVTNPDRVLYLTDIIEYGGEYALLLVPVIGGAAVLFLSLICYLKEKHRNRIWPISCGITSLVTTIAMIVSIIYLGSDLAKFGENSFLGPAPYILVFGGVLQIAGAIILLLNTALTSPDLKIGTKPVAVPPYTGTSKNASAGDNRSVSEKLCPSCHSPIRESWQICPVCGRLLR